MNPWFPLQHDSGSLRSSSRIPLDVSPGALAYNEGQVRSTETVLKERQLTLMSICIGAFFILFLGKALFLQSIQGDHYRAIAENNRTRMLVTPAIRGVMYDANGQQLVQNAPAFTLIVTSSKLPKDKEARLAVIETAANIAGMTPTDIDVAIAERPNAFDDTIPVDRPLTYEAAMALYLAEERLPGISVELLTVRSYNTGPLQTLSHVLGYTGFISPSEYDMRKETGYRRTDKLGKQGLELTYETALRGRHGTRSVEVDALGREILLLSKEEPTSGYNLHLTIDAELTTFIEERLNETLQKIGKQKASVVVIDPRDGGVRALVSVPGYDNNAFAQGISSKAYQVLLEDVDQPLFPRATFGEFPPGSTFKPTIAGIALENGLIDRHTSFLSSGGIAVNSWFFPDWKAGGHGITNVTKAIAESVNTFFYVIGGGFGDVRGLGIEQMTEGARLFGFGAQTGIDLPQEADGFLPSMAWKEEAKGERWYIGDTYHAAIGQGDVLVTPLQMAMMTSVFANGGTLYAPHLLSHMERDEETISYEPRVTREQVVSENAIAVVREGMRQAVTEGSARSLSFLSKPVAAKTGTAQAGGDRENHAWFTSFGPYENPELVVTVLVEEGGEGSSIAAPIARDIFAWWFANRSD